MTMDSMKFPIPTAPSEEKLSYSNQLEFPSHPPSSPLKIRDPSDFQNHVSQDALGILECWLTACAHEAEAKAPLREMQRLMAWGSRRASPLESRRAYLAWCALRVAPRHSERLSKNSIEQPPTEIGDTDYSLPTLLIESGARRHSRLN